MIVGPGMVTFLCRNFVLGDGLFTSEELRNSVRTVGAALRGRPLLKRDSRTDASICERPRAATEGRPYSTFVHPRKLTSVGFHISSNRKPTNLNAGLT